MINEDIMLPKIEFKIREGDIGEDGGCTLTMANGLLKLLMIFSKEKK